MSSETGFDFDLFVIGGGSGGVRAARIAAQHGARVGLAEEYRFGGTCVIRGCVPKKLMVYASGFSDAFEDAVGFGWSHETPSFDWAKLIAAKDAEISRLEQAYRTNLDLADVTHFTAHARVADPHHVGLSTGQTVSAKHILVAVGGRPFVPDIPGREFGITSNDIFDLRTQPKRMLIHGGGYIACEFAGIMNGLGTHVTQIYRGPQILRGFDDDIRNHVAAAMRARGVNIQTERDIIRLHKTDAGIEVALSNGATRLVDCVMFATGRIPHTRKIGLRDAGVDLTEKGVIKVDEWSQTNIPSIYAVGDVTDRAALTPVAIREGHAFADTVFGGTPRKVDHTLIPTAIFTRPEAATIGLTEAQAREKGPIDVYRTKFTPMLNTLARRNEQMMMKLIVAKEDDRILGAHMVGPGSGEMVQLLAIPMRIGATKADFDATMAVHPTLAEEWVTLRNPLGEGA